MKPSKRPRVDHRAVSDDDAVRRPRLRFALHAVERYRERHAPHLNLAQAQALLHAHAASATRLRDRSRYGHEQLRIDVLGVVLVVKRDNAGPICVTVLPRTGGELDEKDLAVLGTAPAATPIDAPTEALRIAMRFVSARAANDAEAAEVRDSIARIAPWTSSSAFLEGEVQRG